MYRNLFAVIQVVGNDERIIRTFTEKDAALDFARECGEAPHDGVIACIQAYFDADMRKRNNECRIYEVYD